MYKIIKILDRKTVLINYGKFDKAKVGEKIKVVEIGEEIYDLNNIFIGTLDSLKAELEIIRVEDQFSLCQKIEIKETNPFTPVISLAKTTTTIKDLNVKEEDISNLTFISNKPIEIGDIVKKY